MRKLLATLMLGVAMAFGAPDAAEAQQNNQFGLVNVVVGDVIVAPAVNLVVAANIAAQICGVQVGNVGILAVQLAKQGQHVVCTLDQDANADGQLDQVIITRPGNNRN